MKHMRADRVSDEVQAVHSTLGQSMRRWVLALMGILCVGLAALGAVLPGLPTTIFLIAACFLFTRSCPKLERILVRNRFFAVFHQYLDGPAPMPFRAKVTTLVVMWLSILISIGLLSYRGGTSPLWIALIPGAGIVGSYFIAFRKAQSKPV